MHRPTLRTKRLVLRPFTLADAPRVQQLAGAREVALNTLTIPHPYPDGAAEEWIESHDAKFADGTINFAIDDGELVGAIGLMVKRDDDIAEIGYWIGMPYWGRGYATEAGEANPSPAPQKIGRVRRCGAVLDTEGRAGVPPAVIGRLARSLVVAGRDARRLRPRRPRSIYQPHFCPWFCLSSQSFSGRK